MNLEIVGSILLPLDSADGGWAAFGSSKLKRSISYCLGSCTFMFPNMFGAFAVWGGC
jgi:hypothetical protein